MWLINGFKAIAQGWYGILSAWFVDDRDYITFKTNSESQEKDRSAIYSDWCRVGKDMRKAMGYENKK